MALLRTSLVSAPVMASNLTQVVLEILTTGRVKLFYPGIMKCRTKDPCVRIPLLHENAPARHPMCEYHTYRDLELPEYGNYWR